MVVFHTLLEAIKAGFQVVDRTQDGYLVHQRMSSGQWALARVVLKVPPPNL